MSLPLPDVSVTLDLVTPDAFELTPTRERLEQLVRCIVGHELAEGTYVVGLHFVDDEAIRALNAEHRGKDSHTDVLSFPLHDPNGMRFVLPPDVPAHLGDVVVSYPRAAEQAREFGHSLEREVAYLVAHGVLHILGYDHEAEDDRRRMRHKEEAALAPLGLTR
jgi:probable rRNA maturation factor